MIKQWFSKPLPLVLASAWFFLFEGVGGMLIGFFFLLQSTFAQTLGLVSPVPALAGWLALVRGILFALTALVVLRHIGHGLVLLGLALFVELIGAVYLADPLPVWILRLLYLPLLFMVFHAQLKKN